MISKRHCPFTGIVNFFAAADPLIAIGSVSGATDAPSYAWRCYLDDPVGHCARHCRSGGGAEGGSRKPPLGSFASLTTLFGIGFG